MSEFINAINGPEVTEISYKVAEDWDALYEMLKMMHVGDEKSYEDLVMKIEDFRLREGSLDGIPNTGDLHDALNSLREKNP